MSATKVQDAVREVRLFKQDGFHDATVGAGHDQREVWKAIGYLSQWALHCEEGPCRQCKLDLAMLYDGEMRAVYRDKDGNVTYVMGAVLGDDGTYSFHS